MKKRKKSLIRAGAVLLLSLLLCTASLTFGRTPAPAGTGTDSAGTGTDAADPGAEPAVNGTDAADAGAEQADTGTDPTYTDVAVLTTTDMHGKCWDTSVLTGAEESSNMLRISTAVRQIREEYGEENVLLIDNGDLFQGNPVSQIQLTNRIAGGSSDPPAMALCLKEMDYDAFVPGNHEFNFSWTVMSEIYQWLEDNGVPVVAANIVYDGTDGVHEAGENAFTPYVVRTIMVNGHEHRIGILGLENTDITRWDTPSNYPGLMFAHPGNDNYSMKQEAEPYLSRMREEGCEFIIVSYHAGVGTADRELSFGVSTENQGMRLVEECEGINMLILGHDHLPNYSNTFLTDPAGKQVLTVNGGGQDLTRSIFRFSEDDTGALTWELMDTHNIHPGEYEPDEALETMIKPYAELAETAVGQPVGTAAGDWDQSGDYYIRQTDTMDLISAAMIAVPTKRMAEKYGGTAAAASEDVKATDLPQDTATAAAPDIAAAADLPQNAAGLDHLDVDMGMSSVTITDYVVKPGDITTRDLYQLYIYNNTVLVIPMKGRDIRAVMEENAANRLLARAMGGKAYTYMKGDRYTNLLFGGLNFTYDLSKPEGERVQIEGFSNGRPFEEDRLYLVAVNNYILGNNQCGLRDFSEKDAVWKQTEDSNGETIQDIIAEYLADQCADDGVLTPEAFPWHWSVEYTADLDPASSFEGEKAAVLAPAPEDGHTYVIYYESEGCALTDQETSVGLQTAEVTACGEVLAAPLPAEVLTLTAHVDEAGRLRLTDSQGRYLSIDSGGALKMTAETAGNDMSAWKLEEAYGGWYFINIGSDGNKAIEFIKGKISPYRFERIGSYLFNFYEVEQ